MYISYLSLIDLEKKKKQLMFVNLKVHESGLRHIQNAYFLCFDLVGYASQDIVLRTEFPGKSGLQFTMLEKFMEFRNDSSVCKREVKRHEV